MHSLRGWPWTKLHAFGFLYQLNNQSLMNNKYLIIISSGSGYRNRLMGKVLAMQA